MVGDNDLWKAIIAGEVYGCIWDVDNLTSHKVDHDPDVEKHLFANVGCGLMVGVQPLGGGNC